jgi:ubiquinone/menaquinone biosynthesis C-methylase UbiE
MPHPFLCPWWLTWTFDNPVRRLIHDPQRIVGPFVHPGDMVADIGCGMGHFSLGLARAVGPSGRVLAIDLQARQLEAVNRRAAREGLQSRIETRAAQPAEPLPLPPGIAFALAFWMLHEVPGVDAFLAQVRDSLAPGGTFLVVEPSVHVGRAQFDDEVARAKAAGFSATPLTGIRFSRAVLLRRAG